MAQPLTDAGHARENSRAGLAATLIAAIAIVAALGTGVAYRIHMKQVRSAIQEQNSIRMMALADRVTQYFTTTYLFLSSAAADEHFRRMESSPAENMADVFNLWWQHWQVSSLMAAPAGYDGQAQPPIFFPGEESPISQVTLRTSIVQHLRWFGENPDSRAQITNLAGMDGAIQELLYSVPMYEGGIFTGLAAVTIPVDRIENLLAASLDHAEALLVNENNILVSSQGFEPKMLSWFQTRFREPGIIAFFDRIPFGFDIGEWRTLTTTLKTPYGRRDRWWLVFQYDEDHALRKTGARGPFSGYGLPAAVGGAGLLFAWLTYLYLKGVQRRTELESLFAHVAEGILGKTGGDFFTGLAKGLATGFDVPYAMVCEVAQPGGKEANTLAMWSIGSFEPEFSYELEGSPCGEVVRKGPCLFAEGVRQRFPNDPLLARIGAESYRGVPLLSQQGESIGILSILDTVPMRARQQRHAALLDIFAARAAGELERVAAEQRQQRLEAQLHQAQKMDAVGRLAGGIAHDFNNLLQAIQGYENLTSEMLEPDHPAQETLAEVRKAGERAAELVRRLLAFTRMSPTATRACNVNEIIADMLRMVQRLLGENIETRFDPQEPLPVILADASRLEQVLMNLCLNARDAMPEGGRLMIHTKALHLDVPFCESHPWARPGEYVCVGVADTGTGISPDILDRIYEPFFTTKAPGHGTGLGLSTVYAIMEQHHGFIHTYSEEGLGTQFHLYLLAADTEEAPAPAPPKAPFRQGGNETILYAEDDPQVHKLVAQVLREAGYQVFDASNGEESIEIAKGLDRIDLAILDIVMPRKGGREAAKFLRGKWPSVPILFCSGYSERQLDPDDLESARVPLIEKPFSPQALLERVREILDGTTTS